DRRPTRDGASRAAGPPRAGGRSGTSGGGLPGAGRGWGGVARRGAFQVGRSAGDATKGDKPSWVSSKEPPEPMDRWVRVEDRSDRPEARLAKGTREATGQERSPSRVPQTKPLPTAVAAEIRECSFTANHRQRKHLLHRAEQKIE